MPEEALMTVEDVMAYLRVSRTWCYHTKLLPWIRVGNQKRLRPQDLEDYLNKRRMRTVMRQTLQPPTAGSNEPMD